MRNRREDVDLFGPLELGNTLFAEGQNSSLAGHTRLFQLYENRLWLPLKIIRHKTFSPVTFGSFLLIIDGGVRS
jgi:hypothetical protein